MILYIIMNNNDESYQQIKKININISTKVKSSFISGGLKSDNQIMFCSSNKLVSLNYLTGLISETFNVGKSPIIKFAFINNNVNQYSLNLKLDNLSY